MDGERLSLVPGITVLFLWNRSVAEIESRLFVRVGKRRQPHEMVIGHESMVVALVAIARHGVYTAIKEPKLYVATSYARVNRHIFVVTPESDNIAGMFLRKLLDSCNYSSRVRTTVNHVSKEDELVCR